jgi:hypothetical protein
MLVFGGGREEDVGGNRSVVATPPHPRVVMGIGGMHSLALKRT